MDEKTFKERASRLKQVGAVIESLPVEIRSAAFELLRGYVSAQAIAQEKLASPKPPDSATETPDDQEGFCDLLDLLCLE